MDSPDLWVFPPALPIGALILGFILERFFPLAQWASWFPETVRLVLALALLLVGAATFIGSHVALRKATTGVFSLLADSFAAAVSMSFRSFGTFCGAT